MRSRLLFAAACTVAVALAGAVGATAGGSSTRADVTIGFSVPSLTESFWVSMDYGVQKEAKKLGVKVVTVSAGGDANANQQISQLQDLIQRHVDALIVGATDGNAVKSVVEQAVAQGIPVIGLSSIPNSPKVASAVGADHYGMGKQQAQCLGGALHGKGQVGMLAGPSGQSWADLREKGFRNTLRKLYPNIKVVAESRLADNRNAALSTVETWIQRFPALSGIYSATDDIGSGAVDAIQAAHKSGSIKVSSSNFSPAAQQLLLKGSFVCVSVQRIVTQGVAAVDQAVDAASSKPVKKNVVTPVLKLTKANFKKVNFDELRAPVGFKP